VPPAIPYYKILKQLNKIVAAFVAAIGIYWTLSYAFLAEKRQAVSRCMEQMSPNGRYLAKLCRLDTYRGYIKLYDNQSNELIADRVYWRNPNDAKINFSDNEVQDWFGEGSSIGLPPSWLDRLRAKLP